MRKTLVTVALVCAIGAGVATIPGCNSAWWQNFKNDPVEQVQTFEATVQVGINAAELAWPAILQAISPASQAQVQLQFTNAIAAVNHGLQVLNDAVNAAVAAQQPTPDFSKLMQAVSDALSQVIAIVDEYMQPAPAPSDAGVPPAPAPAPAPADAAAPPAPAPVDAAAPPAPVADAGAPTPPPAPSVARPTAVSAAAVANVSDLHAAYQSLSRWGVQLKTP